MNASDAERVLAQIRDVRAAVAAAANLTPAQLAVAIGEGCQELRRNAFDVGAADLWTRDVAESLAAGTLLYEEAKRNAEVRVVVLEPRPEPIEIVINIPDGADAEAIGRQLGEALRTYRRDRL